MKRKIDSNKFYKIVKVIYRMRKNWQKYDKDIMKIRNFSNLMGISGQSTMKLNIKKPNNSLSKNTVIKVCINLLFCFFAYAYDKHKKGDDEEFSNMAYICYINDILILFFIVMLELGIISNSASELFAEETDELDKNDKQDV